jgi:hypothetical protein
VLKSPISHRPWLGNGSWYGIPYRHLGVTSAKPPAASGRGEASDFCGPNEFCSNTPVLSILFAPVCDQDLVPLHAIYYGYALTGQWREYWQGEVVSRTGYCSPGSVGLPSDWP